MRYRKRSRAPHPTVRPETLERRARMQQLHREGYTVEEISIIVDRSIATVRAAVRFMPLPGDEE